MSERLWHELRAYLGPRRARGWYLDEDEMGWCFGLGGGCRLAVSARGDDIVLYDADSDEETVFGDVQQLAAVLPELEHTHRGFSAAYRRILDSPLQLDTVELAEHQRQLAVQDAAFDGDATGEGGAGAG